MLKPGDLAPDFQVPDGEGGTVRLSDLRGKRLVLYFYPKDMTPGCTQQACDFRDRYQEIQAAGAVLLGVSPDSEASHRKFAAKHGLPFPLLVDTDSAVATAYGVWKEKSLYGRTYMGVERTTFLIDEQGRIARVWPRIKVSGHGDEVLAALREGGEKL
jgi:thioredoxin-dependent peroxiredoxin